MTPLNRFVLENLTVNSFLNEALAESGLDVDALTCLFFKKAGKVKGQTRYFSDALPESAIGFLSNRVNDSVIAKLELVMATGRNIRANPDDIFRLAIAQVQANPDGDDAPAWLALAAESARQIENDAIPY